jgi:hypothetical protein
VWVGVLVLALVVLVVGVVVGSQSHEPAVKSPGVAGAPVSPSEAKQLVGPNVTPPLVLTYFFYWYDATTELHLRPQDGLPVHLPATPAPSWQSQTWFEQQFRDMTDARIDVALPVYWGDSDQNSWSTGGLGPMIAARHSLLADHVAAPSIGMFYDTSILRGVDLTKPAGIDKFYGNIRDFYQHIPQSDWALVDRRPVVWLFLPQHNTYDQRVFDETYARFTNDFGVRPYIVAATGWTSVQTDATYVWGVAQDGMQATRIVAAAGPGYDDRQVAGRSGEDVPRANGSYYADNLEAAARSGRPLVAIETWNEIHEASAIADTVEYGRTYIDMTRTTIDAARARE